MRESEGWEDRDRSLVLSRLHDIPALRFFSPAEAELLDAVVERLIPQPDRAPDHRVIITPFLDQLLFDDDTDGFRKDGMPWDQEVWRQAVVGIDQTSVARHGRGFVALDAREQDDVLSEVQSGEAQGAVWQELSSAAVFDKVVQEVVSVYYAHPSAWAEIGWPGPASRRGYMRTGYGQLDPWQPRESGSASSVELVEISEGGGSPSGSVGGTH
ncbi:gluconate 2-dehydrogenase subunit 3 family protein [Modestobacter caceresii]|uniref:gluconate 2-dehydrogenase subunit 3 family protein n=1 Tax=Modestobacter caceresii TaxID=1522368 RepID=UPI000691A5E3|nr:gluconate 2-dehydrogenase subunit 3 family protein [Modestobacter caceresii]